MSIMTIVQCLCLLQLTDHPFALADENLERYQSDQSKHPVQGGIILTVGRNFSSNRYMDGGGKCMVGSWEVRDVEGVVTIWNCKSKQ